MFACYMNHPCGHEWFCRSAEQGNGGAQNYLGLMYFEGEGIAKDEIQAYKWAYLSAQ